MKFVRVEISAQHSAFDKYAYNTRSEVVGAQRYHGTDISNTSTVYGGREFGYAYDPIGNRTSATETIGGETLAKFYAANELNQYTAIANPDAVGLRGSATNTAVVTVNGNAALRDSVVSPWTPWHHALEADNANGGVFTFAEIMAAINPPGTNTPDLVSTTSGSVYAPPQSETLTYDDDGNLLRDGRWQYTWNGENRLVKAEEILAPPMRELYVLEYAYDHRGRMVLKEIKHRDAEAQSWEEEKAISYLWDNFNIVAETTAADSTTNTTYSIWGLDLDGTVQGAGGVGGLLAVFKDSAAYIPTWDGNGNVMEYVSDDGSIVAHCEYDPFGGTVVVTGDADAFTHWFSTKPWCTVTGLSEYQFRKYAHVFGRWLNRDPIEERGSILLSLESVNSSSTAHDIEAYALSLLSASQTETAQNERLVDVAWRLYDLARRSKQVVMTDWSDVVDSGEIWHTSPYLFVDNGTVGFVDMFGLKKDAACLSGCENDLANCYSGKAIATATFNGMVGAVGTACGGIVGAGSSITATGRAKLLIRGGKLTKYAKGVGTSVCGGLLGGAGVGILALHAECLSGYAGCVSGCPDVCP